MNNFTKMFACLAFLLAVSISALAQNPAADWMRVQSDDKEFSIEVPVVYDFVYDKDGHTISDGNTTLQMSKAAIFNSYRDKTLFSFESYEVSNSKMASAILREGDKRSGKFTDLKRDGFTAKEIVIKNENYHLVKQYLTSKNNLYILTTASRNGETAEMRRFLNSIILNSDNSKNLPATAKIISVSNLKMTQIKVAAGKNQEKPVAAPNKQPDNQPKPDETGVTKMIIVSKPRAHYTDSARRNSEEGNIELRVNFSPNGGITAINIRKQLGGGLLRQCLFAALKIKFLPQEKDGIPVETAKSIIYSFDIY